MKQRILAAIVAAVMLLSFTGCKEKDKPVNNTQTNVDVGKEGKENKNETSTLVDTQDVELTTGQDVLVSNDFFMPVEDVFSVTGRGTVVTGKILTGNISVGAEIELVGFSDEARVVEVGGIEIFSKMIDAAVAGDSVGIILKDIEKTDVERGQVLAAKGSISTHNTYTAKLKFEEDYADLYKNKTIKALCYFFTTDTSSTLTFSDEGPDADGFVIAQIKMLEKLPMKEGTSFAVRQGSTIIAIGGVTELDTVISFGQTGISEGNTVIIAEPSNENDLVTITLIASGSSKIQVIKEIRNITALGLAEAKGLIDNVPSVIKENIPYTEAQTIKATLVKLGASVEITEKK